MTIDKAIAKLSFGVSVPGHLGDGHLGDGIFWATRVGHLGDGHLGDEIFIYYYTDTISVVIRQKNLYIPISAIYIYIYVYIYMTGSTVM